MKTLVTAISIALGALPANAGITSAQEQLRTFAGCAGRLSAMMEWQWMFDGAGSEVTARQRATMISLINATMGPEDGRQVLAWRIDAKAAHQALLTRATFGSDPADSRWAQEQAETQLSLCGALLLS